MGNQVVVQERPVRGILSNLEQIREQKRNIERSIRNIEREKRRVETEDKKMRAEIKKMAKNGQHNAAKMLARDIVRTKAQIDKMTQFTGQLKAVSLRMGTISTLNELSNAMDECAKAMTTVSSKLDAGKLQQLAKNMALEDAKLDTKQDMISDILDGIGEGMDDPAETEKIYQNVLREVGIEVEEAIPQARTKQVEEKKQVETTQNAEDDSLDAMLKQLQK